MTTRSLLARVRGRLRLDARFETKVVLAVVLVSLVPLIAMLTLGQGFLATAITQGLNAGIEDDLERGFAARRELFETMKSLFARQADLAARAVADALPHEPS